MNDNILDFYGSMLTLREWFLFLGLSPNIDFYLNPRNHHVINLSISCEYHKYTQKEKEWVG